MAAKHRMYEESCNLLAFWIPQVESRRRELIHAMRLSEERSSEGTDETDNTCRRNV